MISIRLSLLPGSPFVRGQSPGVSVGRDHSFLYDSSQGCFLDGDHYECIHLSGGRGELLQVVFHTLYSQVDIN